MQIDESLIPKCSDMQPPPRDNLTVQDAVKFLAMVAEMLKKKNRAYGNSAGDPVRIFSRLDAEAGLRVRIDDKLSRITRGAGSDDEDTIKDLVGYLALLWATINPTSKP